MFVCLERCTWFSLHGPQLTFRTSLKFLAQGIFIILLFASSILNLFWNFILETGRRRKNNIKCHGLTSNVKVAAKDVVLLQLTLSSRDCILRARAILSRLLVHQTRNATQLHTKAMAKKQLTLVSIHVFVSWQFFFLFSVCSNFEQAVFPFLSIQFIMGIIFGQAREKKRHKKTNNGIVNIRVNCTLV